MAMVSSSYTEMSLNKFTQAKRMALAAVDLSKKGSVDKPIVDLIQHVNSSEYHFTTSSCSGRIIIVVDNADAMVKKKGCKWLYVTHGEAVLADVLSCLKEEPLPEAATLKFEPFIMHVQCLNLESARQMLQLAVSSGYRNSGISLGKSGKIILAVRSTAGLEVPLISQHQLQVTDQYIELLIGKANEKMITNHAQVSRLFEKLKEPKQNENPPHPVKGIVKTTTEKSTSSASSKTPASISESIVFDSEQSLTQLFDPV